MSITIDKCKNIYKEYKIWLFIVALFSSNGIQAYLNIDPKQVIEHIANTPTSYIANKPNEEKIIIKLISCDANSIMSDHINEHHGGK